MADTTFTFEFVDRGGRGSGGGSGNQPRGRDAVREDKSHSQKQSEQHQRRGGGFVPAGVAGVAFAGASRAFERFREARRAGPQANVRDQVINTTVTTNDRLTPKITHQRGALVPASGRAIARSGPIMASLAGKAGAAGAAGGAAAGLSGLAAAAGPAAIAVSVLAAGFTAAAKVVSAATTKIDEVGRRALPYSAELQASQARRSMAQVRQDMHLARLYGADIAANQDARFRVGQQFDRIGASLANAITKELTPLHNLAADLMSMIPDGFGQSVVQGLIGASPHLAAIRQSLGIIEKITSQFRDEQQKVPAELDLFGVFNEPKPLTINVSGREVGAGNMTVDLNGHQASNPTQPPPQGF